jgi:glycosyltransferase involved in cell wall biosynthesis
MSFVRRTKSEIGVTSLSVIILTFNEERHIGRCVRSLSRIAGTPRIFVVDSFSTDSTVEIARSLGAEVVQHRFVNQARQFNWALETLPITTDWIMRLDADEVIEADLAETIATRLHALPADVVGVNLDRKHIFLGRWIRHGGRYPLRLLRIWRTGHGRVEDRWMDEHVIVHGGRTTRFAGGFADHNLNDLGFFTDKHNGYATREAIQILVQRHGLLPSDQAMSVRSASFQASAKRFMKEKLYNRTPFYLSSLGYFLWRYIVQLGFLDGRAGLVYHFLQGFWYRFLVGAKVVEFERGLQDAADKEEMLRRLSAMTGHDLGAAAHE